MTPGSVVERTIGAPRSRCGARAAHLLDYCVGTILTQTLFLGIVASSLIFLSAYGGMVSLAQVALYGIAGFVLGNVVTNGNTKGLNLGWNPWLAVVLAIAITVLVAVLFGLLASRSVGIYFLMITLTFGVIANLFFGQVTTSRVSAGSAASPPRTRSARSTSTRTGSTTSPSSFGAGVRASALRRPHALRARTPGCP